MLHKILVTLAVLAVMFIVLFPRQVPKLFRRFGRGVGNAGRVGKELATGVEEPNSALADAEMRAGDLLLQKLLVETPPCEDPDLQASVTEIGARLAVYAERRQIEYRFIAIEDAEPRAYAAPGGTILISRALVHLCSGDGARLAGIIAHEIQHVDRRHSLRQLTAKAALATGLRFFRLGGFLLRNIVSTLESQLQKGYSPDQELEADQRGAQMAEKAGFSSQGLAELLAALQAPNPESGEPLGQALPYFATHPSVAERLAGLRRG